MTTMSPYNWDSEDYERHSRGQLQWARELIAALGLRGDETLLDIGCGDGKVTAELALLLPRGSVVGIDNSAAMIALADKRYPRGMFANLSFARMDASGLGFAPHFDVVFSNAALHWVRDHRPVARGIFSALQPGGRMLLQMGGRGNAGAVIAVLDEMLTEPRWNRYFEGFTFPYGFQDVETYRQLLAEAGFTDIRVELIDKDMRHDGVDSLTGWLRTTWLPYTERVPPGRRDEFVRTLAERYLQIHPLDSDGTARVAMVRLEAAATKPMASG